MYIFTHTRALPDIYIYDNQNTIRAEQILYYELMVAFPMPYHAPEDTICDGNIPESM